jgi:hypothetical protein
VTTLDPVVHRVGPSTPVEDSTFSISLLAGDDGEGSFTSIRMVVERLYPFWRGTYGSEVGEWPTWTGNQTLQANAKLGL